MNELNFNDDNMLVYDNVDSIEEIDIHDELTNLGLYQSEKDEIALLDFLEFVEK